MFMVAKRAQESIWISDLNPSLNFNFKSVWFRFEPAVLESLKIHQLQFTFRPGFKSVLRPWSGDDPSIY